MWRIRVRRRADASSRKGEFPQNWSPHSLSRHCAIPWYRDSSKPLSSSTKNLQKVYVPKYFSHRKKYSSFELELNLLKLLIVSNAAKSLRLFSGCSTRVVQMFCYKNCSDDNRVAFSPKAKVGRYFGIPCNRTKQITIVVAESQRLNYLTRKHTGYLNIP